MNVRKAAIQVLKEAGKPLHATEIAKLIIETGLWKSDGKTPQATVSANLYTDIKKNGDKSAFVKVAPQTFALRNPAEMHSREDSPTPNVQKSKKPQSVNAGFSFTDCAQKVLDEFGGKTPMHYKEITEKALENGWLVTSGKTPEATMNAQVSTEIKRQQKRGERPRFALHGPWLCGPQPMDGTWPSVPNRTTQRPSP